ncbi:MAG: sigma-54-dependent Fis family transcriptional regulator [Deltaproteobacteria bacterium]|nr:sigma-54-dependent Fis family transcriptional regulator [Deltaproteobacteria bacterium]
MSRVKPQEFTVLVVDDERNIRRTLRLVLEGEGYRVEEAGAAEEIESLLARTAIDLLILDIKLPAEDGLSALKRLRSTSPQLPVLMISGHATIADAVEATRLGALDFFEKPLDRDRVLIAVRNALERANLEERIEALAARTLGAGEFEIIGDGPAMQTLKIAIAKVAPTPGRVLITGESGTGKELVARAVHAQSRRCSGPFVKVNCAAISPGLIESELFGHERGSFSGAERRKRGLFELADGGSIFLDEIGDMSLSAQAKVLRVLQTGEFSRVGSERALEVDVRVIAATNSDLEAKVRRGEFREDLYYRLAVVPLEVPPLRVRREDIPLLAKTFVERFCQENGLALKRFSDDALAAMAGHTWPGNVRELRNLCERLVIMGDDPIGLADLPREMTGVEAAALDLAAFGKATLKEVRERVERELIVRRLEQCDWNVTRAAEELGIERTNLHKKMKQLGLRREGVPDDPGSSAD